VAHLTVHHFFDWRWFSFSTFTGWMVVIAHTFNAFAAAVYMMVVVCISCCWRVALLTAAHDAARLPAPVITPPVPIVQVERAKKCLDFAVTLYFVHSVICISVSGFSRSFAWCAAPAVLCFALTAHAGWMRFHAFLSEPTWHCSLHPRRWLTVAVGLGITSVLGEWLCLQREMRDIVIGGPRLPAHPAPADRRMRPSA
jgi:Integral membrane protein S linking to the trans Golgi network